MKFIKKKAQCVAIKYIKREKLYDWRCPTCGMGIAEDYVCCPYCRQRVFFIIPDKKMKNKFNVTLKRKYEPYIQYEFK